MAPAGGRQRNQGFRWAVDERSIAAVKSVVLFTVLAVLDVVLYVVLASENLTGLVAGNTLLRSRETGIGIRLEVDRVVTGRTPGDPRMRYVVAGETARVFPSNAEGAVAVDTLPPGETVYSYGELDGWHRVTYRGVRIGWISAERLSRHVPAWKTGRLMPGDVELILQALKREGVEAYTVYREDGQILADSRGRTGMWADDGEMVFIKRAVFNNAFRDRAFDRDVRSDEQVVDLYVPVYYSLNRLLVLRCSIPMHAAGAQWDLFRLQTLALGLAMVLVHVLAVLGHHRFIVRPYVQQRSARLASRARELADARQKVEHTYGELSRSHAVLQDEIETARDLQLSLIPEQAPCIPGFAITARYQPARRVGGDYYDVYPIDPSHVGVLVADASGHGIPAAFVVSMAKMAFSSHAVAQRSSAQTMTGANAELARVIRKIHHLTAFYLVLDADTGTVSYTNAGHPSPILQRTDDSDLEFLDTNGVAVGMMERSGYGEAHVTLQKGDRLLMFTDGLLGVLGPSGDRYGQERLAAFVESHGDTHSEALVDSLLADVRGYADGESFLDDVTVVVLERV